jgi:hypothetical protein
MSKDGENVNFATTVPPKRAEDIEEFRTEEGLPKSEALRQLIGKGLKQHEEDTRLYERAALASLGVLFAAAHVVLASMAVVLVATVAGVWGGADPSTVLVAGLSLLGLLALAAIGGGILHYSGFYRWADRRVESLRQAFGIKP